MPRSFDVHGTTALVTGASSGIGEGLAREFARRGADLVLVARRVHRLEEIAADLARRYGTTCTVIGADLARSDGVAALVAELRSRGIRPSTLVNGAGFGSHGPFAETDPDRIRDEVHVNVVSVVELTRALLPALLADGRGALITVASTAAFQPTPWMAIYGATKAFVQNFTEALAWEVRESGLRVLSLNPGPTSTEFFEVAKNDDAVFGPIQTADQVVATAFTALERWDRPASVISGLQNRLQTFSLRLAPRALVLRLVGVGGRPKQR